MTKRKQKHCIICGKRIKTGYKYCFEHRNTRSEKKSGAGEGIVFACFMVGFLYFIGNFLSQQPLWVEVFWWVVMIVIIGFVGIIYFKSKTGGKK